MTSSDRDGRQRLIDAAAVLFADRGYDRTSIADIADRSGVSRGSVPWHFGNKAGILTAVVDQKIGRFLDTTIAQRRGYTVEAAVESLTEFTQDPSTSLFVTLLSESMRPDSSVLTLHADLHGRILGVVIDWLDRVLPSSDGREQRAMLVLATVIGVQQQWRVTPERIDVPGTFRLLLSSLAASSHH